MIAGRFGHKGLCQLRGRNVLQSLLLILLRICSRSVRPISTKFTAASKWALKYLHKSPLRTILYCKWLSLVDILFEGLRNRRLLW